MNQGRFNAFQGYAGECLVMADILLSGILCYPTSYASHHDITMEFQSRLYRIQVKTCIKADRNKNLRFCVGRSHPADIVALVDLTNKSIRYIPQHQIKTKEICVVQHRFRANTILEVLGAGPSSEQKEHKNPEGVHA